MVEQWFSQEEYKLKLEATNKQTWKNITLDQCIADCLTKTIEQEAQRPNFFISRGSDRFPPFVKLTFAAVEDKFLFEKSLKNLRPAAKDQKHKPSFMSYRMTPAQFEPIKKDLLEAARAKLTEDFIEKVKKSNTNTSAESSTYNQGRSSWRVLGSFSKVFINKLIAHDRYQNYEHEQNF